jgi:type IV secretory pathway VirD2 relaxase
MGDAQHGRVVKGAADDLHRQWQPVAAETDTLRQRRAAGDIELRRQ